jgi:hypothetical protein
MPRVDSSSEAPSHLIKSIGFFPSLAKIIISPNVLIHLLKNPGSEGVSWQSIEP